MTDASLPLQAAIVAALRTALTTAGYSSVNSRVLVNPAPTDAMPYIVFDGETGVEFPTKTTEGMECNVSLTAWDDNLVDAKTLGQVAIAALTDRTAPLTVSGFAVAYYGLDFRDAPQRFENPPETYWGIPFRVRFRLVET